MLDLINRNFIYTTEDSFVTQANMTLILEMYKIITGKYEGAVAPRLERDDISVTRDNELRLKKFRPRYDLRKYSFTNRVVNIWNSLPNKVVLADSVNCFKSPLDKF